MSCEMEKLRVVVTGLGIVSPIGCNVNQCWRNLIEGYTGVTSLGERCEGLPCTIGAPVRIGNEPGELNLDRTDISKSELRTMTKSIMYALVAGREALLDANWFCEKASLSAVTGVSLGMGMVDLDHIQNTMKTFEQHGYRKISPYFVPAILPNMAAGHLSIKYNLRGPNHSASTACATGAHAIGDGLRIIQSGQAKVMVCGGTDSCINRLSIAGFCRARSLSLKFNDRPSLASRPFDSERDGFVMGEGCGVVVLEELNHALARKCKIYAEILGYGMSGDASHLTAPRKDGEGIISCINNVINDAGLKHSQIGYINAHATSTPMGDKAEGCAIAKAFPDDFRNIFVSSTKGHTGHLLGAAGSVEAIFTVLSCYHKVIPHTLNLNHPDKDLPPLRLVMNSPTAWGSSRSIAISNSFGFGGTNCSLCFSRISI